MFNFTFMILVRTHRRTHRRLSLGLRLLGSGFLGCRAFLGSQVRVGEARSSSSRGGGYIVVVSVVIVLFVVIVIVEWPWGALK